MSSDQEVKEIGALEKLYRFLDQFDCWWISNVKYDFENDPNIIIDSCKEIEFYSNAKDLLEDK